MTDQSLGPFPTHHLVRSVGPIGRRSRKSTENTRWFDRSLRRVNFDVEAVRFSGASRGPRKLRESDHRTRRRCDPPRHRFRSASPASPRLGAKARARRAARGAPRACQGISPRRFTSLGRVSGTRPTRSLA
jgi:hypothetical protein